MINQYYNFKMLENLLIWGWYVVVLLVALVMVGER